MNIKKIIVMTIITLITLCVLGSFIYKERMSYGCYDCRSRKHEYQWFIGLWGGFDLPISFQNNVIDESRIYKDFFNDKHKHNWQFSQGSPYYFFGTRWGGCALGRRPPMNDFVGYYEVYEDFREYVKKMEKQGKIDKERILSFLKIEGENEEINEFIDKFMSEK